MVAHVNPPYPSETIGLHSKAIQRHGKCQSKNRDFTDKTVRNEGGNMIYEGLKKVMASMVLAAALVMSVGLVGDSGSSAPFNSVASAQSRRGWVRDDWRDRDDWRWRVSRMDRDRRVRYRMNNRVRVVGYYDRFGRFHAYGFVDRFGRFHRY